MKMGFRLQLSLILAEVNKLAETMNPQPCLPAGLDGIDLLDGEKLLTVHSTWFMNEWM